MQQTTTMLKFTPTFHPPNRIIKKPQTHFTNFPNIHKITNNKPFQITNSPNINMTTNNKPFHISSCSKKDNADANSVLKKDAPKNSTLTSEKELQLSVSSAFEPIFSAVKWVFSSLTKLVSPYTSTSKFNVKHDQLLSEHTGKEIVGVVQHVVRDHDGLLEMTVLCEHGLLKNLKISSSDVVNQTLFNEEENEKMWRIYTVVECKDNDFEKMEEEIKDIINAHDELKCNSKYNFVGLESAFPIKILVKSYVTLSKLKTPRFEHYMELRRKVLSEIDEIRCKHGGSKDESEVLAEIDKIQRK